MSSGDHCALSFSFTEKNNKSSAKGCMKNVKHSMSNAKDCKQDGTVKKHKRSEKKKVQVTLHQCQDFYEKKRTLVHYINKIDLNLNKYFCCHHLVYIHFPNVSTMY